MFNPTARFADAVAFATAAHAGQLRKYSGRPYIEHPVAVARMTSRFVHDEDMLLAAVLHDTVEDTPRAKTVKLMDLVHNCVSIVRHDAGFAGQFLSEMQAMLAVLHDASDPAAWALAQRIHVRSCARRERRQLDAALR